MTAEKFDFKPDTITVKKGDPIKLVITAVGHDHGLKIDAFHIKEKLMKGQPVTVEFTADQREDMDVVFTLLAERYERGSVLMTSNLQFSKWEGIFKDAMMTAAAIDRLVHHCVIIELNIPSYRAEEALKNQQAEEQ